MPNVNQVQQPRPLDVLNRSIPHADALDFVRSCEVLDKLVSEIEPDIVIYPARGAGPIRWTMEAIADISGNTGGPLNVDLPIGTNIGVDGKMKGISGQDKLRVCAELIKSLYDKELYIPGKSRVMVVDEVQKGGTILQAAEAIKTAMWNSGAPEKTPLNVVAFQDTRKGLNEVRRTSAYGKLTSNSLHGLRATALPTSMFMVDVVSFLDKIEHTDEDPVSISNLRLVKNQAARTIFPALVQVKRHPEDVKTVFESFIEHDVLSLGQSALGAVLLEHFTDPVPVRGNKSAHEKHVFNWWENYFKKVANQ